MVAILYTTCSQLGQSAKVTKGNHEYTSKEMKLRGKLDRGITLKIITFIKTENYQVLRQTKKTSRKIGSKTYECTKLFRFLLFLLLLLLSLVLLLLLLFLLSLLFPNIILAPFPRFLYKH